MSLKLITSPFTTNLKSPCRVKHVFCGISASGGICGCYGVGCSTFASMLNTYSKRSREYRGKSTGSGTTTILIPAAIVSAIGADKFCMCYSYYLVSIGYGYPFLLEELSICLLSNEKLKTSIFKFLKGTILSKKLYLVLYYVLHGGARSKRDYFNKKYNISKIKLSKALLIALEICL